MRNQPSAQGGMLRVAVHDFGGYPFVTELSRVLAQRGHEVVHLYADGFRRAKASMQPRSGDPPSFSTRPVRLAEDFEPGGIRRVAQERRYGKLLREAIRSSNPQVVISTNAPIEVQAAALATAHAGGAAFVSWVQDLHSVAIRKILSRRSRILGAIAGTRFARLERHVLARSDAIVAVSRDFLAMFDEWSLDPDRIHVIGNWAPLTARDERTNPWSIEHELSDLPRVMYAGTLASKHDPRTLIELARAIPNAQVIVVAEGAGADWLAGAGRGLKNLEVLPLQPFEQLPQMLASADVLVAILQPDAAGFSAPSKVLTYLAAGKPIVAAIDSENAAAQVIMRARAGVVVDPSDAAGFAAAVQRFLTDSEQRIAAGDAGLAYAREAFDLDRIADRFEGVFRGALERNSQCGSAEVTDTLPTRETRHGADT